MQRGTFNDNRMVLDDGMIFDVRLHSWCGYVMTNPTHRMRIERMSWVPTWGAYLTQQGVGIVSESEQ